MTWSDAALPAAILDRESVMRELIVSTSDAYYKAQEAKSRLEFALSDEQSAKENTASAAGMLAHGAASITERLVARKMAVLAYPSACH